MSPFLAWGDFHARSRFARSTIPEEKWGTTRSLTPRELAYIISSTYVTKIIAMKIERMRIHFSSDASAA